MGYTTTFTGALKFEPELVGGELAILNKIFGEDVREHPEWGIEGDPGFSYVDLKISDDFRGIEWDGSEKSYEMCKQVNLVMKLMKEKIPDFNLIGEMSAQGEEALDRWTLVMKEGVAYDSKVTIDGDVYKCPHCEGEVIINEAEKIT